MRKIIFIIVTLSLCSIIAQMLHLQSVDTASVWDDRIWGIDSGNTIWTRKGSAGTW